MFNALYLTVNLNIFQKIYYIKAYFVRFPVHDFRKIIVITIEKPSPSLSISRTFYKNVFDCDWSMTD